ncbi:uncharacterized protein MELLADRAFT_116242 [Melampsora larici-populina 98AG31]|uniref:Uncharacterized protein n=1 Tax=Melampsora larici-populina (strain 98AG31 / pathotype 3-4-7) TaxID=747676 RepID=F4RJC9_MELLP|nr:uncharacterized protein MELLADRAFT_116242 [Melampsora larici-populina 98AG31]EGG07518.1 hypothetical protein MELLADRAFT_116242 [Melampsora larici-populina 98AG31]
MAPTFEDLLHRAPANENPFRFVNELIEQALHPSTPTCAAPALVFFGIVYGANILVCLAILIIPLHRGPASKKKYQTPWKSYYIVGSNVPYYIPNSGLFMAILQLFTCVISEIYVAMLYYSAKSPRFQRATFALVWVEIRWLPMYLGIWSTAWASFAFCLCSARSTLHRFLHFKPLVFNSFCFSFAILVFLLSIYWTVLQLSFLKAAYYQYDIFFKQIHSAIIQWDHNGGIDLPSSELNQLTESYDMYVRSSKATLKHTRSTYLFWTATAIPILTFYAISVWALLSLVLGCAKVASGQISVLEHFQSDISQTDTESLRTSTDFVIKPQERKESLNGINGKYLRRKYINLVAQSSCLFFGLFFDTTVGIYRLATGNQSILHQKTRVIMTLLGFGGSLFIFLAMTIQCYYMITEKKGQKILAVPTNEPTITQFPIQFRTSIERSTSR